MILDSTSGLIDIVKTQFGIDKPNDEMTDDEIRQVIRYFGDNAPDTVWIDDKPVHGKVGIGVMLFLTITEFPWFYEKYELWQRN